MLTRCGGLQGARYYAAQLPYLSSNAAVSYVFNYDNVLPGAAYLLAEATSFNNASYVVQARSRLAGPASAPWQLLGGHSLLPGQKGLLLCCPCTLS